MMLFLIQICACDARFRGVATPQGGVNIKKYVQSKLLVPRMIHNDTPFDVKSADDRVLGGGEGGDGR